MDTKKKDIEHRLERDPNIEKVAVDKRAKYDRKRSERDFLLAIYMPKAWKQPLLGVALRDLCKALLERQASLGRGRKKLKTLIVELTDKIRSGS